MPRTRQGRDLAHRVVAAAPRRQRSRRHPDAVLVPAVPGFVEPGDLGQDAVQRLAARPDVDPAAGQHHPQAHSLGGAGGRVDIVAPRQLVMLHDGRDAAAQVLHQPQQSGQILILRRHRGLRRPDDLLQPAQQRPVVRQPAQESLRQVGVAVDQAGQHRHVPRVDDAVGALPATRPARRPRPTAAIRSPSTASQPTISDRLRAIVRQQCAVLDQDTLGSISHHALTRHVVTSSTHHAAATPSAAPPTA